MQVDTARVARDNGPPALEIHPLRFRPQRRRLGLHVVDPIPVFLNGTNPHRLAQDGKVLQDGLDGLQAGLALRARHGLFLLRLIGDKFGPPAEDATEEARGLAEVRAAAKEVGLDPVACAGVLEQILVRGDRNAASHILVPWSEGEKAAEVPQDALQHVDVAAVAAVAEEGVFAVAGRAHGVVAVAAGEAPAFHGDGTEVFAIPSAIGTFDGDVGGEDGRLPVDGAERVEAAEVAGFEVSAVDSGIRRGDVHGSEVDGPVHDFVSLLGEIEMEGEGDESNLGLSLVWRTIRDGDAGGVGAADPVPIVWFRELRLLDKRLARGLPRHAANVALLAKPLFRLVMHLVPAVEAEFFLAEVLRRVQNPRVSLFSGGIRGKGPDLLSASAARE